MTGKVKSITVRLSQHEYDRLCHAISIYENLNPLEQLTPSEFVRYSLAEMCLFMEGHKHKNKHVVRCEYCRLPIRTGREIAYYLECSDGLHRGVCVTCASAQ